MKPNTGDFSTELPQEDADAEGLKEGSMEDGPNPIEALRLCGCAAGKSLPGTGRGLPARNKETVIVMCTPYLRRALVVLASFDGSHRWTCTARRGLGRQVSWPGVNREDISWSHESQRSGIEGSRNIFSLGAAFAPTRWRYRTSIFPDLSSCRADCRMCF